MAQGSRGGIMTPRRFSTWAALCGTVVFAGWAVAGFAEFGSSGTEDTDAAPIADGRAAGVAHAAMAAVVLPGTWREPLLEESPVDVATLNTPDPVQDEPREAVPSTEPLDECLVVEICIDDYLFTLYGRTQKVDANKIVDRKKVTVKKNGKTRTVVKSFTKVVDQDFAWKDPNAAERAGMSMKDYVIGGMEASFKVKLFRALRAMDAAGLEPGITSAFRDDYRQSIASGLKAASNRSYHGGSLRGGYGHGLAADIVSINGATRDQRYHSSEALWKWVDANGQQYGIGRPYLRFAPPHVGPISGPEYVSRRGGTRTAAAGVKKRQTQVAQARHSTAKPQ